VRGFFFVRTQRKLAAFKYLEEIVEMFSTPQKVKVFCALVGLLFTTGTLVSNSAAQSLSRPGSAQGVVRGTGKSKPMKPAKRWTPADAAARTADQINMNLGIATEQIHAHGHIPEFDEGYYRDPIWRLFFPGR
jgi:hypothetical protein